MKNFSQITQLAKIVSIFSFSFLIAITAFFARTQVAFAATSSASAKTTVKASPSPSPSPTPTPVSDQQTTQNLKDRIDKVLEQRQHPGSTDQNGSKKRGIIGQIQRISEKTVTFKTHKGTESLTITPDVIILKDTSKASFDDLAVGDWVLLMGVMDKEVFQLRKLVISPTSLAPKPLVVSLGTLISSTKTQAAISTRPQSQSQIFVFAKNVIFEDREGTAIKREQLETETELLVVGLDEDTQKTGLIFHSLVPPTPKPAKKGVNATP